MRLKNGNEEAWKLRRAFGVSHRKQQCECKKQGEMTEMQHW